MNKKTKKRKSRKSERFYIDLENAPKEINIKNKYSKEKEDVSVSNQELSFGSFMKKIDNSDVILTDGQKELLRNRSKGEVIVNTEFDKAQVHIGSAPITYIPIRKLDKEYLNNITKGCDGKEIERAIAFEQLGKSKNAPHLEAGKLAESFINNLIEQLEKNVADAMLDVLKANRFLFEAKEKLSEAYKEKNIPDIQVVVNLKGGDVKKTDDDKINQANCWTDE